MAKPDMQQLRNRTEADLRKDLRQAQDEAVKLRIEIAIGKTQQNAGLKVARRQVARLLTVIREKQLLSDNQAS